MMRMEGIEPSACGLKDRCSLAPRREPLTTELHARVTMFDSTFVAYDNLHKPIHTLLPRPRPAYDAL